MDDRVKTYFQHSRKIIRVMPDSDYQLLLTFDNREQRIYKMENELTGVFAVLKDKRKFESVFLDEFGNVAWDVDTDMNSAEHWNNRIDLCKDALCMESVPV